MSANRELVWFIEWQKLPLTAGRLSNPKREQRVIERRILIRRPETPLTGGWRKVSYRVGLLNKETHRLQFRLMHDRK